jgi:hypothetical protein
MVHPESYVQFNINSNPRFNLNFIVSYRPGHYDIPVVKLSASSQRPHYGRYEDTPKG